MRPLKLGSAMMLAPMVLNALTTFAPGAQEATSSPAENVVPTSIPLSGSNGLVASIRILPARSPAAPSISLLAFHGEASSTISLCCAAASMPARGGVGASFLNERFHLFRLRMARTEHHGMSALRPAFAQRSADIS